MQDEHSPAFVNVPEGWDHFECFGKVIEGTPFLPAKVFLPNHALHSPEIAVRKLLEANVGLILDLTMKSNPEYYPDDEFAKNGISVVRLPVGGHSGPPRDFLVDKFRTIVDGYLERKKYSKLICVHCTHGVNRTGYMLARYMMDKMNFSATEALKRFADARPPGIWHRDYIIDLFRRAEEKGLPPDYKFPKFPAWEIERLEPKQRMEHSWVSIDGRTRGGYGYEKYYCRHEGKNGQYLQKKTRENARQFYPQAQQMQQAYGQFDCFYGYGYGGGGGGGGGYGGGGGGNWN